MSRSGDFSGPEGWRAIACSPVVYQDADVYVRRADIIQHLADAAGARLNRQTLSTKVLADARNKGVILASTDRGVKIPRDALDLHAWMERTESQVAPYLRRVEAARRRILMASHNQHDITDPARFPELARYLVDP